MSKPRQTQAKECRFCGDRLIMHRIPICLSCRKLGSKALFVGGIFGGLVVKLLSWWLGA